MGHERRKPIDNRKRGTDEHGRSRWLQIGLVIAGLALIVLALGGHDLLVITKKETKGPEATAEYDATLVVGVFAAGVLLVLVGALVDRITEVTMPGGAGIKLDPAWASDANAAARQAGDADESEEVDAKTLVDLRLKLEQKLTWLAKHFVGPDGEPLGFVTPGSLTLDKYLTDEQARTAARILSTPLEKPASDSPDWDAFLDDGKQLAGSIRASAVYERTRHLLLDGRKAGSEVSEVVRKRGRRPDLELVEPGKLRLRIATAFPYSDLEKVESARRRLEEISDAERLVVVPRRQPPWQKLDKLKAESAEIPIVYLDELAARLAAAAEEDSSDRVDDAANDRGHEGQRTRVEAS